MYHAAGFRGVLHCRGIQMEKKQQPGMQGQDPRVDAHAFQTGMNAASSPSLIIMM